MQRRIQQVVRSLHAVFARSPLPDRIALYFHGVEDRDRESFAGMVQFMCAEQGYQATDALGLVDPSAHRKIFISFDDNYRSWEEARRLFDRLKVRVTFYVNTLPFECAEDSEELAAYYRRLGYVGPPRPLSRGALRALREDGHTIGAHTHSHHMLMALPEELARKDIARSKELLENILGAPMLHFSYPYGQRRHFSESLRAYCLSIGFTTVANGIPGMQHCRQMPERIQRSPWLGHRSLAHNLLNLRIDGRLFERITGRSVLS